MTAERSYAWPGESPVRKSPCEPIFRCEAIGGWTSRRAYSHRCGAWQRRRDWFTWSGTLGRLLAAGVSPTSFGLAAFRMVRHAAPPAIYSLIDQAAVSLANFAISLWLARLLAPVDYSAFTLAYSFFLLAGMVHSALVTEPMLVHANGAFKDRVSGYLNRVRSGAWLVTIALSGPLLVGAAVCAVLGSEVAGPLVAFAVAGPFILFHWTARRACYALSRPAVAARFDLLYLVAVPTSALVAGLLRLLTAEVGALLMGAGSAFVGWLVFRALPVQSQEGADVDVAEARQAHWTFGRWLLGSTGLRWVHGNAVMLISTAFLGLSAAGELRVVGLLLMPVSQAITAVGPLLSPMLTRARGKSFLGSLGLTVAALVAVTSVYCGILLAFGAELLDFVFGAQYAHLAPVLAIFAAVPILSSIGSAVGAGIHAQQKTVVLFWGSLVVALVSVGASLLLVPALGLAGAAISEVVSAGTYALVLALGLVWVLRWPR